MKILNDYINKNMRALRKRLNNVVENQTDRDDIIQEACVAILTAQPDIADEKEMGKYFTRVLFTKVAAYKNSQCDVTQLSGFVLREEAPDSDPLIQVLRAEDSDLIPELIEVCGGSDATKTALSLIHCEGCSPQDAADYAGIKRSAVDVANYRFKKAVFGIYEGMRM